MFDSETFEIIKSFSSLIIAIIALIIARDAYKNASKTHDSVFGKKKKD